MRERDEVPVGGGRGVFCLCECVHGCAENEANWFTRLQKTAPGFPADTQYDTAFYL